MFRFCDLQNFRRHHAVSSIQTLLHIGADFGRAQHVGKFLFHGESFGKPLHLINLHDLQLLWGKLLSAFHRCIQRVHIQEIPRKNTDQPVRFLQLIESGRIQVLPLHLLRQRSYNVFQLALYIRTARQKEFGTGNCRPLVFGVLLIDFLQNDVHLSECGDDLMQIGHYLLFGFFLRQLLDFCNFLRCTLQEATASGIRLQALQYFRPKFGNIVRRNKAVVCLIHYIGVVIVEQRIHDLLHRLVLGQLINILFDIGI